MLDQLAALWSICVVEFGELGARRSLHWEIVSRFLQAGCAQGALARSWGPKIHSVRVTGL